MLICFSQMACLTGLLALIVSTLTLSFREMLINLATEMKRKVHRTQRPRHISTINEQVNITQQSDSLVQ